MNKLREIYDLLLMTVRSFGQDKGMKMSASLAYYAIFSVAPLLLIVIWLVGFLFGEYVEGDQGVQGQVFAELTALFGESTALQIQDILKQISVSDRSGIGIAIGIGTLIFGSTKIFIEIQDSINMIWKGWRFC